MKSMSASAPDTLPTDLVEGLAGRYRIERSLGAGGMATVFLARDLVRDRPIALKVLRSELAVVGGPDRFDREIRLAAGLVHPHILPLLDSGETAGRLWYTMPFVAGETLAARLARERQLPVEEAVGLAGQIASALDYAHRQGIVHRDIKPANILLADGQALVADFGIARALDGGSERLTATGFAIGTPEYMSPEQASGDRDVDARSDLYALASVCYEMLAGEPPFRGPTAQAVLARRMSEPPPSIRTLRSAVSPALDAVLRRALAPVAADRYRTTGAFAEALHGALAAGPVRGWRARRALALGGGVVLAAMATWAMLRGSAGTSLPPDGVRLAVVPFRLIGGDSGDRYLASGLTHEIHATLANLSGLRVIDQRSVEPYADEGRTTREIGRAVRATALLVGDVQRAGPAIRIRVRLVDPATEEDRWSQQYDHTTDDIFELQSEIASRIAGLLRIQLAEGDARLLHRPPTTDPVAYDRYLRATSLFDLGGVGRPADDPAVPLLSQAIERDSAFALAWAARAARRIAIVFTRSGDPALLDQAEADIGRALAIDSSLALAWKARHDLRWNAVRGWHFPEALADVRRALALQPSLVEGRNALGSLYFHYGFTDEAQAELEQALSLDPRDQCDDHTRCSGFSRPRLARIYAYRQQYDSALAVYDRMPFLGGFIWEKAVVLTEAGRPAASLALLDSATTLLGAATAGGNDIQSARALAYAALGDSARALAAIASAAQPPSGRSHFHHAQFNIAAAYARLGRNREAVEWLGRTAANGLPNYPLFRHDPSFRNLQGDPDYEALMQTLERQFARHRAMVATR